MLLELFGRNNHRSCIRKSCKPKSKLYTLSYLITSNENRFFFYIIVTALLFVLFPLEDAESSSLQVMQLIESVMEKIIDPLSLSLTYKAIKIR